MVAYRLVYLASVVLLLVGGWFVAGAVGILAWFWLLFLW